MRCPTCGHENPSDRRFCTECGASLAPLCPSCGARGESGEKFCGACGAKAGESAAGEPSSPAPGSRDGERRQLTVMFADLANSTALSGVLDPEDLRDALRRYHDACAEAITRCGGYVGKWLGDGVLAYFGYPASHEDDAQRAIRAGIEIIYWAREQAHSGGETLAVRVGLHTGLTVIGDMGSGERVERADVVGETPNIAARVQSVAPPNSVVISATTERLAHGFFLIEALGEQQLKGVTRPIEVFRILGESGAASRLDTVEHLTPLVGRDEEIALLLDRWNKAVTGDAQVVVISGEPGIGKSRLARTLRDHLPDEHVRIELRCSQIHQNSALYPLIEHFQRVLQGGTGTPTERLASTLRDAGMETTASVPLFAALLGLDVPESYAPLDLTPEQQKQKTLEVTLAWLDAEARKRPVLLVCEDLHWMDPSTLELVGMLVERSLTSGKLVLLTCRPEFTPPWPMQANIAVLQLTRLGRDDADEVMTRVAGGRALPAEVAAQIAARTDGVPLFVEELTKMVLESALLREDGDRLVLDGALPPLAIPETLHDSLMARLDRLVSAKEVAQLGATIGREFGQELIATVSLQSPSALAMSLDALVESGLAYRRGLGPSARYAFKHALIQDAAYQSLLKSSRGRYHQRIGDALAQHFPKLAEEEPEVVAHHYTEAGMPALAVGYWQVAGERAVARSAHREAIAHLQRALDMIALLPPAERRDRDELAAQIALGAAFRVAEGYGPVTRSAAAYARARELCYELGASAELVVVLFGLWGTHLLSGDIRTARDLAIECMTAAEPQQDPYQTVQACRILGASHFYFGSYAACEDRLVKGASLYDFERDRAAVHRFQTDGLVGCLMYRGWAAWFLGRPDQARTLSRQAVDHARVLKHHHTLALALCLASFLDVQLGDLLQAQTDGEEALLLCIEREIPQWAPMGQFAAGAAIALQGEYDRGVRFIDEGLGAWARLGSKLLMTWVFGWKAEAMLLAGRNAEAVTLLADAMKNVEDSGERLYEPELHRLHGEALRSSDNLAAEQDFRRAIEVARELGTPSLELRGTASLARLWQSQGRGAQALALLAPVYGWFTEGFDTRDLIEARALLDDLGFSSPTPRQDVPA